MNNSPHANTFKLNVFVLLLSVDKKSEVPEDIQSIDESTRVWVGIRWMGGRQLNAN